MYDVLLDSVKVATYNQYGYAIRLARNYARCVSGMRSVIVRRTSDGLKVFSNL